MGTWSASITGNDTARDLYIEFTAAFYKYDADEALNRIDQYVRTEMFDETDEEEWCNYFYSLADFMWKKGILTETIRNRAIEMIDSDFGLALWAEEGQKQLDARKQKLEEFRQKLLSPQPSKKKIKPNVHTERVFEDGDIVAVQLKTAGKPYTEANWKPMSEEAFHALDGKYVLMQLVCCSASWTSKIVPEVKDYWAYFRLFDGIYDALPEELDVSGLKDAPILSSHVLSSVFFCESNLYYFKKRNYKVICNRKDLIADYKITGNNHIFWGINHSSSNPDSQLVSAMGNQVKCCVYAGTLEERNEICRCANRYARYIYEISGEENEARFEEEERLIAEKIDMAINSGGIIYSISFARELGVVTINQGHIDNLYIEGQYQHNGFGTRLLEYAFSVAGDGAFIDVPVSHKVLLHICEKLELMKATENDQMIRMVKP